MTLQRRPDLDAAKGWGMLLVVLGHATPPDWAKTLIYGFHMPLFFAISGLLWKGRVQPAGVLRSLMLPFWWGSVVTWLVWVAKVLLLKPDGVPLWGPLLATAYGGDLFGYLVHNGALWFLPALFAMFMVVWLLKRVTASRVALAAALAALGTAALLAAPCVPALRTLPLSLGQGLVGGIFFAAGWLAAGTSLDRPGAPALRPLHLGAFAAGLAVLVVAERFNGRVDLFSMQFGQPVFYVFDGLLGTVLMLALCRVPFAQWAPMRALGARSLRVLVFHQPLLWILRFVLAKAHVQPNCAMLTAATLALFLLAFEALDRRARRAAQRAPLEIKS